MFRSLEARVDRLVERLVRGQRLPRSLHDPTEEDIVTVAAALAAGRVPEPRMSPHLRRRLAHRLAAGGAAGWDDARLTRRTAIGAAAGVLAGALGATAFERLNGPASGAPAGIAGGIMKPGGGRWIQVARLADLSELRPARVVAGDLVAYLFRSGDSVRAVSAICSHLPCALNWESEGALLNCPCHNVNFTAEGRPVGAGYELPSLPSVDVRVSNGVVEVHSG